MDMNHFNLFIKLVGDEYKLSEAEILRLSRRLLADDQEFKKVWDLFKDRSLKSGVDPFKILLQDLIH